MRIRLRGIATATAGAVLAAGLAAGAPSALAHGGSYQPPQDPPPEEPPPPRDPPPPPDGRPPTTGGGGGEPGGPVTPGGGEPGGPTTPRGDVPGGSRGPVTPGGGGDIGGPTTGGGDGPRGPATGPKETGGPTKTPTGKAPSGGSGGPPTAGGGPVGGPVTPGGAPTGGPTTGAAPPTAGTTPTPQRARTPGMGPDSDHWSRWWYANRSALLDLEAHIDRTAVKTPDGTGGAGSVMWRAEAQRLLTVALGDRDEDVASSAAIALGKGADASDAPALVAVLRDRTRQQPVREAAALGLGLIGASAHPASADATRALEAAAASDREPDRLRAMSVWALGLRRDPAAVPFLIDTVTADASTWDVPAAATSALGLSGCDLAREPLLAWLDGTAGRRRRETTRRVHAAHALAHLGDRSAVPALREVCRDDDEDVRRSAVLALGALAARDDEETALLLVRLLDRDKDRGVRNMAALSLGRIAPKQAERALRYAYAKSDSFTQCFAALGLGLLARTTGEPGLTGDLRHDLKDRANADLRGALAVALGLARDRAAARTLRTLVEDRSDPELRAHAALALAMVGDAASADALRGLLTDTRDPVLQREAAMALGLLGDVKALDVLTRLVADGSSLYVQGAAAVALGRVGGADAAKTLGKLLEDTSRPGLARGMAAVGLGCLLDTTGGRGLGRVGAHLDWYRRTPSVDEILTIL